MSMARAWVEYGYSMGRVWLEHLTRGQAPCEMARVCLDSLSVRRVRTLSPTPSDYQSDAFGLRSLRYVVCLLLMMVVGVNTVWGAPTYYVFKNGNHFLAHNGYTTNGSEICVEDEFSPDRCLWEDTENKKRLKTYGAEYYLQFNTEKEESGRYRYPLVLKPSQYAWDQANTNGIKKSLLPYEDGTKYDFFVCFVDGEKPCWKLVQDNNKVVGATVTITTDQGSYQGPQATISGDDELSDFGEHNYSATPTIETVTYSNYNFGGADHFWYENRDNGDTVPIAWSGTLTSSWSIAENGGYASIAENGTVTIHKRPANDLTLTIQLTVTDGTHSCVFTKPVILKGTNLYVLKDDSGQYMQKSNANLGMATTFDVNNTLWERSINGVGYDFKIIEDASTYYLYLGGWDNTDKVFTKAIVSTSASGTNSRWSIVSGYLMSTRDSRYAYWDTDTWKLSTSKETNRVKVYPVEPLENVENSYIDGEEEISLIGDYSYIAGANFGTSEYKVYTVDGNKHYWFDASDHNAAPARNGEGSSSYTKTWTLEGGDGYATFDSETGKLSVTALPTTETISLTINCTISDGTNSCDVKKTLTLKPKEVKAPQVSADNASITISSVQPGVTFYYTTGATEPLTAEPTTSSTEYTDAFSLGEGETCIKAIAVETGGLTSEVITYNVLNFSGEKNVGLPNTVTVAPVVYSSDYATPTGMTAYMVSRVSTSGRTVFLKKLDYIPQNVPVLLLDDGKHSGSTGISLLPKDESTVQVSSTVTSANQLKVAGENVKVKDAQVYLYYQGEFVLTFEGTLTPGRFYMYNPDYTASSTAGGGSGGGNAPTLQLMIEGTTDIDEVRWKMEDGRSNVWYTLDGRRLIGQPTAKGIYINNGQKIVIK